MMLTQLDIYIGKENKIGCFLLPWGKINSGYTTDINLNVLSKTLMPLEENIGAYLFTPR